MAAQYYNFLRLGFEGYRKVQQTSRDVARYTADAVAKAGPFRLITDGSELPVFAFALDGDDRGFTVFDLSERLRDRGWLVPAYTFPENREDLAVLRIVVRNGFGHDLADLLLDDIRDSVKFLNQVKAPLPREEQPHGFAH